MNTQVEKEGKEVTECNHKSIALFHVTSAAMDYDAHTNVLISKMMKVAKQLKIDVTITMNSASKIESAGKEADIILLAPELFAMKEEVQEKYPDKMIQVIDQKDYGFMNAENILKAALSIE